MDSEFLLKLQGYRDGELSSGESRAIEARVAADPEAEALLAELRMTHSMLKDGEPVMALPESREFYWNKIEAGILRDVPSPSRREGFGWASAWQRALGPLTGFATAAILGLAAIRYYDLAPFSHMSGALAEVENESEHTGLFSFRSHAENMLVVWVYDKNGDSGSEADMADADEEDFLFQ